MKKTPLLNTGAVFTTGYEGREISDFLTHLADNDIQLIVDVREIPISRKKGFSKNVLQQRLAERNIDYLHIKSLGSPSSLRKKLYEDGDFEYFSNAYVKYLHNCENELEKLYEIVQERISCLLCFEKNPSECHRSLVADKVSKLNGTPLEVKHI